MPCRIITGYVSQKYIIAALFCWVPVTCRVWSTRSWTVNSPPYKAATVGIGEWWYLVATVPSSESKCSHLEHLRNLYQAGITVPPFLCPSMDNTGAREMAQWRVLAAHMKTQTGVPNTYSKGRYGSTLPGIPAPGKQTQEDTWGWLAK